MLKRLRRKFIIIVMTLVGTVLVAVLGSTYLATYQTQRQMIEGSLQRSIRGGMDERPTFGGMRPRDNDDTIMGGYLSLLVDVSDAGIVLESSDAPVIINAQTLADVIEQVLADEASSGRDATAHIAWESLTLDDDVTRIAIVDTSSSDALLRQQAIKDIQIVCVALAVLFCITWWLSNWALKPVEHAWEQQRRFVADASHELKTPLAVILANTQILQKHAGVSEDAMRWVESTADEAEHMKVLVQDLLQLARADETVAGGSQSAMRKEPIDLSELVETSALEFDAIAFERGCMIDARVDEKISITGDPEWIERLVRILIDNACKYAERDTTVDVTLAKTGSHATLSVHNAGNPIDAEDLPHVFERFYRSDKARSREGEGGFGLGLAIAKGIADAHGAEISVTSAEEQGTTFRVVF